MAEFKTKLAGCALAFATLAPAATTAGAQEYPTKPLQLLIPFPPGGIIDLLGRGFAQALDQRLGQRVVTLNRPGGGETIAMTEITRAPADGYTLNLSPVTPLTIQPHRMKQLPFNRADVIPLCQTFENRFYIAVRQGSPFQDVRSIIAEAKANPGKLRYSTSGVASSPHLAGAELWNKAGVQLIDVPDAGEQLAFGHIISGEVDLAVLTTFGVSSQKFRPLVVFSNRRTSLYPSVPTATELGYAVLPSGYGGLFIRAGTPAPVV